MNITFLCLSSSQQFKPLELFHLDSYSWRGSVLVSETYAARWTLKTDIKSLSYEQLERQNIYLKRKSYWETNSYLGIPDCLYAT
jgi:hypothetical protein